MNEELEVILKLKGKKFGGRIEEWSVCIWFDGSDVIRGYLYDSPNKNITSRYIDYSDGTPIRTSCVKKIYDGDTVVETTNSYYLLGKKAK